MDKEIKDITEYNTQLAEVKPRYDNPIRIALNVNALVRNDRLTHDKLIQLNAFSPSSIASAKRSFEKWNMRTEETVKLSKIYRIQSEVDSQLQTAIKDFIVIAASSKRAGKSDVEGEAYVSLGVIYDNQNDFLKANEYYFKYLSLCEQSKDKIGIASACNCIGVNYMLLSSPPCDTGTLLGVQTNEKTTEYINKAITYHAKHLEIGPDLGGQFVSNSNLGLCHGMLGNISQSAKHHQEALRIAIKMQTLYGQSIAVGNLGLIAYKKNDYLTASTCFQQHLQLVQALSDPEAEVQALIMLASICHSEEKYQTSLGYLENGKKICEKENYMNELRRINCLLGFTIGNLQFSSQIDKIARSLDYQSSL